ncbi:MAG: cyclic nucleotide-binding domain-containing protein, partial [Myxococcales bacterium]|nr:cyclic nucleotide-binding domain-containing protein [Myxococcales bacterium]
AGGDRSVRLATLGPGSIFGEMALVSDAPRAASVRAAQASSLLVGSREALDSLAKLEPALGLQLGTFCHRRMISNLTRHSEILSRLPLEDRHRLIASFEPRPLAPGEALIREGDEAGGLALIASGGVEVVGRDAEGDAVRLSELGPGEVVGEISLVLRRPATADVIAIYPTLALVLARERFQDAIREYPGLLNELYEVATRRESETRTVIAQEALGVDDAILL